MNVVTRPVTLFLCGDVMLGRGIDQALPHPCPPELRERWMDSATGYVRLAEQAIGPLPLPLSFSHVWGAALAELERAQPACRIINLETSITLSDAFEAKGINYRMSPANAGCIPAAAIDCCVLANNHVLDFGEAGLLDTLAALERLRIRTAGAGRDAAAAQAPAILPLGRGRRLLVFSCATTSSGVPRHWQAGDRRPGINLLPDLSPATADAQARQIARVRRPGDIVVVSIHWGPNWGYEVDEEQRRFAHALIERADISILHGHSSHHAKAMEVYRNRLILYGCGDFINDYEGISGYEEYRGDLALMYLPQFASDSGDLVTLELVPLRIRGFQLIPAPAADLDWMQRRLDRECARFGGGVVAAPAQRLALSWQDSATQRGRQA